MRVLVTGAGGFIGAHVVHVLRARGHEPIAVTRKDADLSDPGAVGALFARHRPAAVIHLAWYAKPLDYLVSPENLASLHATTTLVAGAFAAGCRKIVGAGTCLEYAEAGHPVAEDHPLDPVTLYASTKAAAWLTCRALAAGAGAELAWARIFHLFGPGEQASRFVPSIAAALKRGERVDVTAGEQIRDYLHVRDVAEALVALLAPGTNGAYNVCSGRPAPLRTWVSAIGELLNAQDRIAFGARPYAPGERMYIAGRNDRLRALGWSPAFESPEAALADAIGGETA